MALNVEGLQVSIRYIAVLGFQLALYSTLKIWPYRVSIRYIAVLGFQPKFYNEEWDAMVAVSIRYIAVLGFQLEFKQAFIDNAVVSIRYIAVLGFQLAVQVMVMATKDVVSIRYIAVLGFQPYQKNTPSDQRRRKRFTHPRRIDHIPTFASLNHDKNTRSTHYTPNAGIEFSQAGFAPPRVNPVQNHT